jgi:hypothetical protein
MDTFPFIITYTRDGIIKSAEIRPCCKEDNVVDYAVWSNDRLSFTVMKDTANNNWVVALKNADEVIDDGVVQQIGKGIEKKYENQLSNEGR